MRSVGKVNQTNTILNTSYTYLLIIPFGHFRLRSCTYLSAGVQAYLPMFNTREWVVRFEK